MGSQIKLTISILISNRPDTVRKCLDSIQPLLEKVSSELILVDTGCGARVRSIIEEYTDNIVDFEWCRDFAKARNAGLERARGEWFLYLDDDEWFDDVKDIIRFFNTGEYMIYGVGLYTTRDYMRPDGSMYSDSLAARLVRLEPDIRFIYRIHECFSRAPGKAKRLNVFTHHYGYAFRTKEDARAHSARNVGLLQEELAEHPGNMRHILQLVQEYNVLGEPDKSLDLSRKAIARAESGEGIEEDYCLSSLYGNAINIYMATYRYDEAIREGEAYIRSSRTDRMVKALIAGRLAIAYVDKENYRKALDHTKDYWETCLAYRKNRDAFIGFETPVTQGCFGTERRTVILGSGVRAAVRCGEAVLAWKWFREMDWQLEKYSLDFGVIRDILKCMAGAGNRDLPYYEKMCGVLLGRQDLEGVVLETVMDCCAAAKGEAPPCSRPDGDCFYGDMEQGNVIRTVAAYANLPIGHWLVKLARLTAAAFCSERGIRCGAGEAEELALEVWETGDESLPYMRACRMPEAVRRLGGDVGHMLGKLPFSRWENELTEYFSRYAWKDTVWLWEALEESGERDSMHMLAWRAACGISRACAEAASMEKHVCVPMAEEEAYAEASVEQKSGSAVEEACGSMDAMLEGLREYSVCRIALCERIYREEVVQTMPEVLPEE